MMYCSNTEQDVFNYPKIFLRLNIFFSPSLILNYRSWLYPLLSSIKDSSRVQKNWIRKQRKIPKCKRYNTGELAGMYYRINTACDETVLVYNKKESDTSEISKILIKINSLHKLA